jgi:SAM-dependent methyltransferase
VSRQRRFYDTREHDHLQAREDDAYSRKLVAEVVKSLGIAPEHRVLEVGAGFGRFTFELLESCDSVVALDLSPRALETLARTRDERGIGEARCRTWVADLSALHPVDEGETFDFVVGFFLLHHLPAFAATIRDLARFLAPGAGIGFVEPNRRNPLFLAQVLCCPDMTWAEEKGMFTLHWGDIEKAYRDAQLVDVRTARFGFFPPQLVNRFEAARRLEGRLERVSALEWLLPFLLSTARRPLGLASGPDADDPSGVASGEGGGSSTGC